MVAASLAVKVGQADLSNYSKDDSDARRANYLRQLFLIARDQKRSRYDTWYRNYRLLNNRVTGSSSPGAPQPRDSEIYPILSSLVGWMTDQEPQVDFFPQADPTSPSYQQTLSIASDLTSLYTSCYYNEKYDEQYKMMLWDAFMYGTGICKSLWDNGAGFGAGNAVLKRVDPWAFYPDPFATSLDDSEFFIEARRMSYAQIERMYPKTAQLLHQASSSPDGLDERPQLYYEAQSTPKAPFLGALPSGNGVWNRSNSSGKVFDPLPGYVVYEFWCRENDTADVSKDDPYGREAYARSRWRITVMCNGYILFNEWADDLWDHGGHPYKDFRFDDIGEFYGISLVDHLASPQLYVNRLLTALQQNAELVGNPIFLEPQNSGTSRIGIINRPGQRLPTNANGNPQNQPKWLEPPSMPSGVMDLVNFWLGRIENTAGLTGLQKGEAPNQRNSSGVINNVQEAAMVRIRSAMTNYGWTIQDSAYKLSSLIAQNYTDPRVEAIIGPNNQMTSLYLKARHFYDPEHPDSPLKFIIRTEVGANRPTSRQARMQESEKLYGLGVVDDLYVLETHGVKDGYKILERKYAKQQLGFGGGSSSPAQRTRAERS